MSDQASGEVRQHDQPVAATGIQDKSVRPTKTAEPTSDTSNISTIEKRRAVVSRLWFRLAEDSEPNDGLDPVIVERLIGALAHQKQARWLSHFEEHGPGELIPQEYRPALEFVRSAPTALSPARARQLLPQLTDAINRFDRQGHTHEEIADFVAESSRIVDDIALHGELAVATFGYLREEGITGPGSALTWGIQADMMSMTLDPRLQALSTVAYLEQVRAAHHYLISRDPVAASNDNDAMIQRTVFTALNNSIIHLSELPGVSGDEVDLVEMTSMLAYASHLAATRESDHQAESSAIINELLGIDSSGRSDDGDVATIVEVMSGAPVALSLVSSDHAAAAISAIGGFAVGLAGDSEKAAGRFFNGGIALLRENRAALPDVDAATVNLETAFYAAALLWAIIGGDLDVVRSGAVNSAAFNLALQVADDEQALANDYVRAALFHLRSIAAEQDPRQLGRVHQSLDFVDPGAEPPAIDLATALVGVIVTMLSESGFAPVDAEYDPMTASLALAQAASAGAEMTPIATYVDRCVRARDDGVDLAAVLGAVLGGSLRGSLLEEIRASSPVDDVDGELPSRPPVDLDTAIGSGIRDAINATSPAEAWRVAQELLRSRSISELSEAVDEFVSSVR